MDSDIISNEDMGNDGEWACGWYKYEKWGIFEWKMNRIKSIVWYLKD